MQQGEPSFRLPDESRVEHVYRVDLNTVCRALGISEPATLTRTFVINGSELVITFRGTG
jgi:hypothetical protein